MAAALGHGTCPVTGTSVHTRRDKLLQEPWRFDILALLRDLERDHPDLPRIGTAVTMAQEIAVLQQDPFLSFPDANVIHVDWPAGQPPRISQRFMGYFGAMAPLPLAVTHEAWRWQVQKQDPSFARFLDIFSGRFVQLLYRAWADVRPTVHAARPRDDRFRLWLGALTGHAAHIAPVDPQPVPDRLMLHLVGLLASRVRSATRLRQMLGAWMNVDLEVEERVASWLDVEPGERSSLGRRGGLGAGAFLGGRILSVTEKIRIVVHCRDLDEYESLLPGTARVADLAAFLQRVLGPAMSVDLRLTLPRPALPVAVLGRVGRLGWTSFVPGPAGPAGRVIGATFAVVPLSAGVP